MGNKAGGPAPPPSAAPGAPIQTIPLRTQPEAPTSQWNKWRTAGSQASIGTTFDTTLSAELQANKPRMTFVQAIMTALAHSRANLYVGDKPTDWKQIPVAERATYFRNALKIIKGIPNLEDLPMLNVYSLVAGAIGTTNKQDRMQNSGEQNRTNRAKDLQIAIDTILGYSDEYLANYGFMTNVAEGVSLLGTLAGRQFTRKVPVASQSEMQQVVAAPQGGAQEQQTLMGGRRRSRSKESKPKKSRKYAKRPSNHTRRRR